MAKIETQFAHIFIHYYSHKSVSTCKLFKSEPTKKQEEKMGIVFGILEINTPSKENSQIITQLINYLEDSYYSQMEGKKINIEKAFENALNEVNQKFYQLLQEKKIYLVGNLNENTIKEKINLAVGVIKANQIHLSYLNNIGIFLIHKQKQDFKLIDIKKASIEDNKDSAKDDTQKIFQNIIQGEINPPDYFFLANSKFLDYVTPERIRKTVTSLPIHKAAEYFKNSLLQFEGHNFAALIIRNTSTETEQTIDSPSLSSINDLNTTETSTEKLLTPSIWNKIKSTSTKAFKSAAIIIKKEKEKIDQKNGKTKTTTEIKTEVEDPITEAQIIETETETMTSEVDPNEIKNKKSINFKFGLGKLNSVSKNILIQAKKPLKNLSAKSSFWQAKFPAIKSYLKLKISTLGNYIKKIPNLSKILLVVAILLILLFVYSTSYFKQQQTQETDSQEYIELVNQIDAKINEADSNIIFGDEGMARESISEAQNLLSGLPMDAQRQREQFNQLNKKIETIIAKLRHISIINEPILITDLSTEQENNININNIVYNNNSLFAFDSLNNNSYIINPETREIEKIYSNLSDIGKIVKAHQIQDKLLLYHDKNGFVEFKDGKYTPITVGLNANVKIADFSTYFDRLYTVDTNANQIYRHNQSDIGYNTGLSWIQEEGVNLSNIVSIGIDTNIWMLDKTGKILKYNKGLKQNFSITNLEPTLESPLDFITNDETNFIYILEPKNKRIVVLDKEGNLNTQYYSDSFDNLKGFAISEKEKKIFLINDNKIYFFNLEHL